MRFLANANFCNLRAACRDVATAQLFLVRDPGSKKSLPGFFLVFYKEKISFFNFLLLKIIILISLKFFIIINFNIFILNKYGKKQK